MWPDVQTPRTRVRVDRREKNLRGERGGEKEQQKETTFF